MTSRERDAIERRILAPLEGIIQAAHDIIQDGRLEFAVLERLLRARSACWAAVDGYRGVGGWNYGRDASMPRQAPRISGFDSIDLRQFLTPEGTRVLLNGVPEEFSEEACRGAESLMQDANERRMRS